jgi:hypothetical protein
LYNGSDVDQASSPFVNGKNYIGIAFWQMSTLCMRLSPEDSEDVHVSSIRSLGIMAFKIK